MSQTWQQFATKYCLDPKYGTLIPPDYKVTSFDFQTLLQVNHKFIGLETDEQMTKFMQEFPDLHLKPPFSFNDLFIMHDFTITIVSIYLTRKRKILPTDVGLRIPKNLAHPLYFSSKTLEFNYGFNTHTPYNFIPLNDSYLKEDCSFGLKDFNLKIFITGQKYQQLLFYGGLAVGQYYLARIIKLLYQCNEIIKQRPNEFEEIKKRLALCVVYWKKIATENQTVSNDFSADYFNNVLRPFLKGFKDIIFEGADEGKDVVASTAGGTAGFQPSFQIFEKAMGLNAKGDYHDMQISLQSGMTKPHKQCINYFKEESLIRDYCSQCSKDVKIAYNQVVKAYGVFLRIHSQFMTKFILDPMKKANKNDDSSHEKGTAGTLIMSIILRYEDVESQVLP